MRTADVEGVVVKETDSAILLDTGDGEFWVPKSLTENYPDTFAEGELIEFGVAEWFAIKEGIV